MVTVHHPVNTLLVHQNALKMLNAQAQVENAVQICVIKGHALGHKLVQTQLEVVTKEAVRQKQFLF